MFCFTKFYNNAFVVGKWQINDRGFNIFSKGTRETKIYYRLYLNTVPGVYPCGICKDLFKSEALSPIRDSRFGNIRMLRVKIHIPANYTVLFGKLIGPIQTIDYFQPSLFVRECCAVLAIGVCGKFRIQETESRLIRLDYLRRQITRVALCFQNKTNLSINYQPRGRLRRRIRFQTFQCRKRHVVGIITFRQSEYVELNF